MEFLFSIQQRIRELLIGTFANYAANPDLSLFVWLIPMGIVFGAVHALSRVTARLSSRPTFSAPGYRYSKVSPYPARWLLFMSDRPWSSR